MQKLFCNRIIRGASYARKQSFMRITNSISDDAWLNTIIYEIVFDSRDFIYNYITRYRICSHICRILFFLKGAIFLSSLYIWQLICYSTIITMQSLYKHNCIIIVYMMIITQLSNSIRSVLMMLDMRVCIHRKLYTSNVFFCAIESSII